MVGAADTADLSSCDKRISIELLFSEWSTGT